MTSNSYKSKTLATWLAFLGGVLGLHRLYLQGRADAWTLLHMAPTAVGLYGIWRMLEKGQDDQLAWLMTPALGLILAGTQLLAIIYGLTPDEKWNARFNASGRQHQTGWLVVIGVILALMVGAGILMATLAFAMQRFFEFQQLAG
jgi:TM2 domain-containing membrane protein YozV